VAEIMYFWEFDVPSEKEAEFRNAAKEWPNIGRELPDGLRLSGLFEVAVGHGLGPRFQAILTAPTMAAVEGAGGSIGLNKLHSVVTPFAAPGTLRNRFLRSL